MAEFPSHPDKVTPEWMSERLHGCGLLSGGPVEALEWEPIGTGQVGDSVRFRLALAPGASGPASVAAKFPAANPTSRATAAMLGLYAKEVGFYRELAPLLDVRVPAAYAAELGEDGGDFVLLLEDLSPARGGDQLSGCSIADARHAIVQAAAIHAPSWHNDRILSRDWLQPDAAASAQVRALYPQAQAIFAERYAAALEPEYMQLCERLAASEAWLSREPERTALVHGDFRLDNMLFDIRGGGEPIAVLDWQTLSIGNPLTDIGYFLGCGIGNDLRRAHERELLELYCAQMRARGIALQLPDIFRDYAIGALHGVATAVFSAAFVERTERGDANFLSMARGACALALEHDSMGLLEEG